ncbi:protein DEHYDRATION-INDUCED 19 isoform X1 [Arachis hypogaea]|uniref:protein DEHYDRATION-INDUCED 19 isoform X1 n=1 Tax=Arachis hypogaea TaxID=3818 RepID=UPI003B22613F|nr:Protein DEHYDRATION-INDUCED [Arachis hypogaea]
MDSDFWTSRIAAAKRHHALHHHHQPSHFDRLGVDDFDMEDGVRPDFPCPYCYVELDILSLCSHLEDEHSCESKVTICPICSVKVARDMLSHITLQHAHLFKLQRRRRLRRVAIPNSQALSLLGRDLREAHLQVLLGGGYRTSSTSTVTNAITDPLLSSLIFNFPALEAEEICKSEVTHVEDSSSNPAPVHIWKSRCSSLSFSDKKTIKVLGRKSYLSLDKSLFCSFDPSLTLSSEEREKRMRQAAGRSGFVQDLFFSALLGDQ